MPRDNVPAPVLAKVPVPVIIPLRVLVVAPPVFTLTVPATVTLLVGATETRSRVVPVVVVRAPVPSPVLFEIEIVPPFKLVPNE